MNRLMIIFMVVLMFVAPVASALEKPSFAEFDAKAASGEARLNIVFFGGSFTWMDQFWHFLLRKGYAH